jgi:hypothetical protein
MAREDTMKEPEELQELKRRKISAEMALREAREAVEKYENSERDKRLEPLKELTIHAHDVLCRWDHSDGCGWYYEIHRGKHNWTGWSHARWLKHIESIVYPSANDRNQAVSAETLKALLDWAEQGKKVHKDALWIIRHRMEP